MVRLPGLSGLLYLLTIALSVVFAFLIVWARECP